MDYEKEKRKIGEKDEPEKLAMLIDHPLRRRILRQMVIDQPDVPLSPREAADLLDRPLSSVSYHFKVLRKNDAVHLADTSQIRGAIAHYYLVDEAVASNRFIRSVLKKTPGCSQ